MNTWILVLCCLGLMNTLTNRTLLAAPGDEKVVEEVSSKPVLWLDNLDQAKKTAKDEGKGVLIYFSGSDWNESCIHLTDNVYDKAVFNDFVGNKYVCMQVDFPQSAKQNPEQKKENMALKMKYRIRGVPSFAFLNEQFELMEVIAGVPANTTASNFVREIEYRVSSANQGWARQLTIASQKTGQDKAKALIGCFHQLRRHNSFLLRKYSAVVKEIEQLDPHDGLGFYQGTFLRYAIEDLKFDVRNLKETDKEQEALKLIDEFLSEFKDKLNKTNLQHVMFFRLNQAVEYTAENVDAYAKGLNEIIAIDNQRSAGYLLIKKRLGGTRIHLEAEKTRMAEENSNSN
jgi:thioredoxin-related protein